MQALLVSELGDLRTCLSGGSQKSWGTLLLGDAGIVILLLEQAKGRTQKKCPSAFLCSVLTRKSSNFPKYGILFAKKMIYHEFIFSWLWDESEHDF